MRKKHPLAAYCLDGLGGNRPRSGPADQSEEHFHESLTVRQAPWARVIAEVAYSLDGLARVAAARGEREEAESLLKEASSILSRELGSAHPDLLAVAGHLRRLTQPPLPDSVAVQARARFLAIPTLLTVGWQVLHLGKDWRAVEANIRRREAREFKATQRSPAPSPAAATRRDVR